MITFDQNKLIGIPFKLNKMDFSGCDCRGIVCLYHKYVNDIELPFSDGKRIFFRDKSKDIERMKNAYEKICKPVEFNDLKEGDIVILKQKRCIGVLGVCTDNEYVLHMDLVIGSCRTKIEYLKSLFLYGYRLNEKL